VHHIPESEVVIPGVDGDLVGVLLTPDATAPVATSGGEGTAGYPAVVVLPEIDGFYAPYGSAPVLRGYADTMAWVARLNDRRQLSDLVQALDWLRRQPGVDPARVAIVGFSIGGRYAMMLTTEPHDLRAVVAFYSRPWPGAELGDVALAPGRHVAQFTAPVCAVFGDEDDLIPQPMVDDFTRLLERYDSLGHEVHVVPGRHFFNNESRPRRYNAASAEEAWRIALDFLATQMGPELSTSSAHIT
jgi:dienelactone hydrolase